MDPRLPSSTKWVPLPEEYCNLAREVFEGHFQKQLEDATLLVEGRIYRHELIVRLGYVPRGSIRQINFEASIDFNLEKNNAFELLNFLMDPLASMLEDFLETKEVDFPAFWKQFTFKNKEVYLQYSAYNSRLEAEADKLLGIDKGLLNNAEGDEAEDPQEEAPSQPLH